MVSLLTCLCMLYNIIVGCTSYWVFCPISLLCISYSSNVSSLYSQYYSYVCACYIYVYCNMLVYFILSAPWLYSIFPVYALLCYFSILVELNSQKFINISLFELVFTCIETHILVTNLSISRIFISVVNFSVLYYH